MPPVDTFEIETRSLPPVETRADDQGDDQEDQQPDLAEAVAAVTELRQAVTESRTAIETQVTTLGERVGQLERRLSRPGTGRQETRDDQAEIERRAFGQFLRRGIEALPDLERRTMATSPDVSGGYVSPGSFMAEILRKLELASPFRRIARVVPIGGTELSFPRLTSGVGASWLSETGETQESTPQFGALVIRAHRIGGYSESSQALLEDAAVDLEGFLSDDFSTEIAKVESEAFITGNGAGKPRGVLTYPDGTTSGTIERLPSGGATEVTADGLIDMFYALAAPYRGSSTWLLNGKTLAAVRKLQDGSGQYLWQPGLVAGQPETLLGRPVIEEPSMPDLGAGTLSIALGDFKRAYIVAARKQLVILRDPFSRARFGIVGFHAYARVGGDVADFSAVKIMETAAS